MLELKNISFIRDNKKILDDINLKLDDDKFIVITGPNGSGKSTLIRTLVGLQDPLGGKIEIEGIDSKEILNLHSSVESGEILRIESKGYFDENGKRGDLLLQTRIVVPKEISKQEREMYKKLQEITNFKPRKHWRWHKKML